MVNNKMGLMGATAYLIGNVVGSGIFITPATILNSVGSVGISLIIWIIGGIISMLGALCYVELGTSIRKSGADFAYICYVKWYPAAFSFMLVSCILMYPAALAIQSHTFSEYIINGAGLKFANLSHRYWAIKFLSFAVIWFLMFLNFFSLKKVVSRFQIVATIAKALAMLIIVGTGFYFLIFEGKTENFENMFENKLNNTGGYKEGLFAGLFSYNGWDVINFGIEEVENPKRTMPLAIIFSLVLITVFFLAMNVAYLAVLAPSEIIQSDAVAVSFGEKTLGYFQYAVPFFISIMLLGSLNSTMFSASRYLYAASREGHLPAFISCVNKFHDSPRVALFVHTILAMICSFFGDLDNLIQYFSFAEWAQRVITIIALIYIRTGFIWFEEKAVHPEAIRTPLIIPIVFFFVCLGLVVGAFYESLGRIFVGDFSDLTIPVAGGMLILGVIIYFIFISSKALRRLSAYQRWATSWNNKFAAAFQLVFNGLIDQGLVDDSDPITGVLDEKRASSRTASSKDKTKTRSEAEGSYADDNVAQDNDISDSK